MVVERLGAGTSSGDLARIYDEHVDAVFGYVARRLGADVARDVIADVFEVAATRLDQYDESRGSHRAWLFGIATNLIRHHWRTEQRRLRAWSRVGGREVALGDPLIDVDVRLDAANDAALVMAAIGELEAEDRDLLLLIVWENCSYSECGEILAIPIGTVRSRLHRVRRQLRAAAEAKSLNRVVTQ